MNKVLTVFKGATTLGFVLLFLCMTKGSAQVDTPQDSSAVEQEVQVPFNESGTVYIIDSTLQELAGVFPEVAGLYEARLFQRTSNEYYVEFVVREQSRLTRRLTVFTAEQIAEIRRKVEAVSQERTKPTPRADDVADDFQSGRTSLLWGSTLWSLFYYGTAVSVAIDAQEMSAVPFLFAGGLGFLVPLLLTANAPVSDGASSLALGGMFQGVLHGWAIAALLQGENFNDGRLGAGISVLTGITETVIGYTVASNTGMSEGDAGVINTTGFYGLVAGGLTSVAVFGTSSSNDVAVRAFGGLALLGSAAGVLAGNAIRGTQHFSSGDASVYATSGLLGAVLPYIVLSAVNPDNLDARVVAGVGLVGLVGGLYGGLKIIEGKDYRSSDGTIAIISTLGGTLIGYGIAAATNASAQMTPILIYAGAVSGFGLGLAVAKPFFEGRKMGSLMLDVNPLAPYLASATTSLVSIPFISARWKF